MTAIGDEPCAGPGILLNYAVAKRTASAWPVMMYSVVVLAPVQHNGGGSNTYVGCGKFVSIALWYLVSAIILCHLRWWSLHDYPRGHPALPRHNAWYHYQAHPHPFELTLQLDDVGGSCVACLATRRPTPKQQGRTRIRRLPLLPLQPLLPEVLCGPCAGVVHELSWKDHNPLAVNDNQGRGGHPSLAHECVALYTADQHGKNHVGFIGVLQKGEEEVGDNKCTNRVTMDADRGA